MGADCRLLNNTLAKALSFDQRPLKLNLLMTLLNKDVFITRNELNKIQQTVSKYFINKCLSFFEKKLIKFSKNRFSCLDINVALLLTSPSFFLRQLIRNNFKPEKNNELGIRTAAGDDVNTFEKSHDEWAKFFLRKRKGERKMIDHENRAFF